MMKASELQFNQKALGESKEEVRQKVLIHTVTIQTSCGTAVGLRIISGTAGEVLVNLFYFQRLFNETSTQ